MDNLNELCSHIKNSLSSSQDSVDDLRNVVTSIERTQDSIEKQLLVNNIYGSNQYLTFFFKENRVSDQQSVHH